MAVIKLTSSKKSLQFVTEDEVTVCPRCSSEVVFPGGTVFQTSKEFVSSLLAEAHGRDLILLTRMPFRVSSSRFGKSPLYGEREAPVGPVVDVPIQGDALSPVARRDKSEKKLFSDKDVW